VAGLFIGIFVKLLNLAPEMSREYCRVAVARRAHSEAYEALAKTEKTYYGLNRVIN
jgi:hypothetical protein